MVTGLKWKLRTDSKRMARDIKGFLLSHPFAILFPSVAFTFVIPFPSDPFVSVLGFRLWISTWICFSGGYLSSQRREQSFRHGGPGLSNSKGTRNRISATAYLASKRQGIRKIFFPHPDPCLVYSRLPSVVRKLIKRFRQYPVLLSLIWMKRQGMDWEKS